MKHLKTYKIFESTYEEKKSQIMEIMRDCEDLGLRIAITNTQRTSLNKKSEWGLMVMIDGVSECRTPIRFSDIRDNINHLISYMKSEGYNRFTYTDSVSEFNKYHGMDIEDNILPPDNNKRESFVSLAKITFYE